jgi:chromate reductase
MDRKIIIEARGKLMQKQSLLLISGSLRKASFNRMLAAEAARHFGVEPTWADIDLPLYNGDVESADGVPDSVKRLADQISQSSAVVISTPEYNQSLSGVLKNALDWISRVDGNPWADKPVAIMSAAAGRAGGARAQYALRLAMNPFQPRLLTGPEVMVSNPQAEFDEHNQLSGERYQKALTNLMSKLRTEAQR